MPLYFSVLSVLLGASVWMACLYVYQLRTLDAGIVDVGWSLGIGAAVAWHAFTTDAPLAQQVVVAFITIPWSLRLGFYLLNDRVRGGGEDGRYRSLRENWGKRADRNFFYFFQVQSGLIVLFSVPPLAAMTAGNVSLPQLAGGLLIGWGAMVGESVADGQLRVWRANPHNRGKTCRSGLWHYSRHPNYFFEWLHWWAYVVIAGPSIGGLIALAGPVLMLLFLYRLTGIPYTERQALKSRGEDYREYQRTTSAFFPWVPRR